MKCDCSIGYPSSYDQEAEWKLSNYKEEHKHFYYDGQTLKETFDKRQCYFRMYQFCPDCGTKINWKKIKEK